MISKTVFVVFFCLFISCIYEDSYDIPNNLGAEENMNLSTLIDPINGFQQKSIQDIKNMFVSGSVYKITSDIYIKGYVCSSDETGNFYKELYLQDDPISPTSGIRVLLNINGVFGKYNFGREVFVNLKGLYVGESNIGDGIISIGEAADYNSLELNEISQNRANFQVLRSKNTEQMFPLSIDILQLNSSYIGMFVRLDNIQFPSIYADISSFVHPLDDFDTTFLLESCEGFGNSNLKLETSKFSDFKDVTVPYGSGNISGIVTKDYNGDNLVVVLNKLDDVKMNDSRCEHFDINEFSILFNEDFENMSNGNISENGWTNFAEQGFNYWKILTSSDEGNLDSKIAKVGAKYSNDNDNIVWLISPSLNLDFYDNEFLKFQTSNSFSDNSSLQLLISSNWDGNINNVLTSDWSNLPGIIVENYENYESWVDSGAIDLSAYKGYVNIAFKYTGGDDDRQRTGSFELDNFQLLVR